MEVTAQYTIVISSSEKPKLTYYYRNKQENSYYQNNKEKVKLYIQANKQKIQEYQAKYYIKRKELKKLNNIFDAEQANPH